jgi:hypothetical protein
VEFEIEKNAVSLLDKPSHQRRTFGGKQLTADFEPAYAATKAGGKFERVYGVVYIERN